MSIKTILRTAYHYALKFERRRQIRKEAPIIRRSAIEEDLLRIGLKRGDSVLLHSSLKSIGYVEGGPRTVIEAILSVISESGTLLIPAYGGLGTMLATCEDPNYLFDVRTTPTDLGSIPEAFLKHFSERRSVHPTHSVAARGKYARELTEAHHKASSTFGYDSPWDRLMKIDGRLLGIGVGIWPIPLSHSLEDFELENFPLPVRMNRTYELRCRNARGDLIQVPVTPHDPKYAKIRIDQKSRQDLRNYFWDEFLLTTVIHAGRVGGATSWVSDARSFYLHLKKLMKEGITIYSSPEVLARRPVRRSTEMPPEPYNMKS